MFRSALARTASLAATSFLALAITSVAHAQSAPAQSGSPEQPGTALEAPSSEIIVTAQKRSERVNDVGMSIQALSNVALSNAGIAAPQDLVKIVPGFNSNPTPYGSNVFTLRGIGYQVVKIFTICLATIML